MAIDATPVKRQRKTKSRSPKEAPSNEMPEARISKRKIAKLNSSDESEPETDEDTDFEKEEEPIVRKRKKKVAASDSSRSPSPSPPESQPISEPPVKPKRQYIKKAKTSPDTATSDIAKLPPIPKARGRPRKRSKSPSPKVEPAAPKPRDPNVRYKNDQDSQEEAESALAKFGLFTFKGTLNLVEIEAAAMKERRQRMKKAVSLDAAILSRDTNSCEMLLLDMNPDQAFAEIAKKPELPLHKILVHSYTMIHERHATPFEATKREEQCERTFRCVFPFLSNSIMAVQNDENNTLINLAINAQYTGLVKFLIAMGSPLHIRNVHGCGAIESALLNRLPHILELLIRNGGTFHYMVGENLLDYEGEEFDKARRDLLNMKFDMELKKQMLAIAEDYYKKIEMCCRDIRGPVFRFSHRELDFGPIVCYPRGKLMHVGSEQEYQFRVPKVWEHFTEEQEFMLAVIPMAWHEGESKLT
uniref:ANK_REP_REGION domain-containing protein n=1 Tax=Caenorhabditis japonica TaxID=281687 RepID=A0A8R1DH95_CAEJA